MKKHQIIAGKYRVVSALGRGGMGTVYRAVHEPTQRTVALKVLRGEVCAENPELVARFEREARATGRVQSHHIVQVFDTGHDESTGVAYLAMELLEGDVLSSLVRQVGPLDPELALRVAGQACLGLGKAHAVGIVHRDVKPANIFLTKTDAGDRVVKLLDFGIAKVKMDEFANADPSGLTKTGSVLGSPHYMSPEQARGGKQVDHRADIWSLGVVLFKMLTGKTPHHEVTGLGDVIIAICTQSAPSVRELAPWVSPEVASVLASALMIDPARRYQTCDDMLQALRRVSGDNWTIPGDMVRGVSPEMLARAPVTLPERDENSTSNGLFGTQTPISLSTASAIVPGGAEARPSAGLNPLTVEAAPPARRSRAPLLALGVLVLAGGATAAWLGARPKDDGPAAAPASAAPLPVAAPASAETTPDKAPEQRTVSLGVAPGGASVEVDGKAVEVNAGKVSLVGALGSVHEVKVTADGGEKIEKVAITEAGPVPAEIKLPEPKPVARGRGGPVVVGAVPKPTAAQPTAESKPPAPKPSGLKASERFE